MYKMYLPLSASMLICLDHNRLTIKDIISVWANGANQFKTGMTGLSDTKLYAIT